MPRLTVARIDLAALQANFRAIAAFVGRAARPPGIIAVVKANAYGHGAAAVGPALERAGARMLACADIDEAVALRHAGVRIPILVFGALGVSDPAGLFEFDLTPTVSTPGAARALEAAAAARGRRLHCHLKIDTGMNRLGFRHDNLRRTLPALAASAHLVVDAVYTHFATAEDAAHPFFEVQRRRFEHAIGEVEAAGIPVRARHAANSAALLREPGVWYDWVRPGLLLYGVAPPPLAAALPLRPVLSLHSRVVAVKGVRPGEGIGYGLRSAADVPRTIAVVPAGYADGLDTRLSGRFAVLVGGRRAPIVGAVSMDMLTIDVSALPEVRPGDEVVLLGEQGGDRLDVVEMAAAIGTIPYEILCRLGARIERVHVAGDPPSAAPPRGD
ncbi:MAG TPA: alanine racemase [Vicinamibacterales bacterium]|nr:alanine racemase [Vicinamibacterales bacterium]